MKQQLLDNIVTYRDERLPFAEGRQRVHILGASLRRSTLLAKLSMAATIAYIIARIAFEIWADTS